MVRFRWFLICLIGSSILLGGCFPGSDKQVPETQNKSYLRGKRYLREDRKNEALEAFLQVTMESPASAPESHLEAGRIYQNTLKDPIAAIYHYRKFLEQRPQGQEAAIVRQMVDSARKDFAAQLPGTPFDSDADRLDLLKMLQEAREQNDALRQELAQAKQQTTGARTTTVIAAQPAPSQPAPAQATSNTAQTRQNTDTGDTFFPQGVTASVTTGQRTTGNIPSQQQSQQATAQQTVNTAAQTQDGRRSYMVRSGDTLSRISQQMYGTPTRWGEIFDANRNILATPHSLRVGQTLAIP